MGSKQGKIDTGTERQREVKKDEERKKRGEREKERKTEIAGRGKEFARGMDTY